MIVITGASGHIGNNLVRLLIERDIPFKVLLRRDGHELAGLEIEKYIGNLYDYNFYDEHIQKGDTVIHLAGYIDLGNRDYKQSYEANVTMTKIIADVCLEKKAKLIFSSSTDILFHNSKGYYIENDVDKIKYNYPKTKTIATLYVKELQEKGLNAIILYPTSVVGINDFKGSQAGKEIIKAAKKRCLPYLKGGYDFIDVIDVSNAIINAVDSDITGDVILSGEYYSIKELYQIIGKLTGKKKRLVYIPSWLAKFGTIFIKSLSPMVVDIVTKSRPFNDPKTKLLLEENTAIEITFKNILEESGNKIN
ncbi:MAG TPA: NAD-dependent epimerase/dehydratase family protein [Acholeplasmataceae bacterium]|nr:NAD-dependent epimerase/dehydratase family protein [Acholeplasmataceae bacterium]